MPPQRNLKPERAQAAENKMVLALRALADDIEARGISWGTYDAFSPEEFTGTQGSDKVHLRSRYARINIELLFAEPTQEIILIPGEPAPVTAELKAPEKG